MDDDDLGGLTSSRNNYTTQSRNQFVNPRPIVPIHMPTPTAAVATASVLNPFDSNNGDPFASKPLTNASDFQLDTTTSATIKPPAPPPPGGDLDAAFGDLFGHAPPPPTDVVHTTTQYQDSSIPMQPPTMQPATITIAHSTSPTTEAANENADFDLFLNSLGGTTSGSSPRPKYSNM